jgi:hypothetical protein
MINSLITAIHMISYMFGLIQHKYADQSAVPQEIKYAQEADDEGEDDRPFF